MRDKNTSKNHRHLLTSDARPQLPFTSVMICEIFRSKNTVVTHLCETHRAVSFAFFSRPFFYPSGKYAPSWLSLFVFRGDLVTGILAALKRGEPFSPKKLLDSLTKPQSAYWVFILIASAIEQQFIKEFPCIQMIIFFVACIELKSIDENAKDLSRATAFFPRSSNS